MYITLSKRKVASSVAVIIACLVGDKNSVPLHEADLAAAICDNITHAIVGMFIWAGVGTVKSPSTSFEQFYLEVLLCGILSSVIDLDHFISAKSLNLKEATSLTRRPLLHCTSIPIVIFGFILSLSLLLRIGWLFRFGWLLVAAFFSHHLRDSTRRGFWLWPFGSTKPTPYFIYLMLEALMPHAIYMSMNYTELSLSTRAHATAHTISV